MAVMGSDLSNFLRTQENGQKAEKRRAQQRMRQQELCENHHGSEALGAQQGVGEVEEEAERDEAGERVIKDHDLLLTAARKHRCSRSQARRSRNLRPASECPAWSYPRKEMGQRDTAADLRP